jgi:glutamate dehydrogenase (NAD(P)+)
MNQGATHTAVVTGKPVALGGSLGRKEATGRGVFTVGCLAAQHIGLAIPGARIAVQGFGNVGGVAAQLFTQAGAVLVAVQDHEATLYQPAGLDAQALWQHVQTHGSLAGFEGAETVARETFWDTPCDVMIPAAMEQQITAENAHRLQARLVIEGANGPTTPAADDILQSRNILLVPDVIANAGGVTVSYFEWVQDFSSFFWTEDEINQRLARIMQDAFASVYQVAQEKNISLRTAAFIVACTRILAAREMRGLYP